jgi:hypothetical protein
MEIFKNGKTAQSHKLNIKIMIDEQMNKYFMDFQGVIGSLITNFNASATGCNNPNIPIKFGPFRCWILPKRFRSKTVKKAAERINIKINMIIKTTQQKLITNLG